jgi:hypothetical protein
MAGVGAAQADYNGTGVTETVTFTSTTAGTVTASFSGSVNTSLSIDVASIAKTYGIGATVSKTVTIGNQVSFAVANGHTAHGQYGAWRAYVTGVEEFTNNNCVVTQSSAKNIYAPYQVGWNTWTT